MPLNPQLLRDRIVLLLVNGMSAENAEGFAFQSGLSAEAAKAAVAEARKKITVAADYTRDEQIGRAVLRLDDLYAKSIAGQDIKTALQAQRELNRLLDLYAGSGGKLDSDDEAATLRRQLELIAAYVLPLKLTDDAYPIEEHVRLAADRIRAGGGL